MKELQQKQRFDLLAVLAVLGIVLMFGFESIFVFELYRIVPERWAPAPVVQEEPAPPPASEPAAPETNTSPVEAEEPPVADEEILPVG